MKLFLIRHYEKILLAALLAVFICLLLFQLLLWRQSKNIQVEGLTAYRNQRENYQKVDFESDKSEFRVLTRLTTEPALWKAAASRDGSSRDFTNFMVPYAMALCPKCHGVIPASAFPASDAEVGSKSCPFCGKNLDEPYRSASKKGLDTDNDGIPDETEETWGLNPKDPLDAAHDPDDDGFSNLEEFLSSTDFKKPDSRPPYHEKMSVLSVRREKLPFRLKLVSYKGERKKENAKVQIQYTRKNRRGRSTENTHFDLKPGSRFSTLNGQFTIVDIIPGSVKDEKSKMEKDQSKVIVSPVGKQEKIVMELDQAVYEQEVKAALKMYDAMAREMKTVTVGTGAKISCGTSATGVDSYTVAEMDQAKQTVSLKSDRNGKIYVVGKDSVLTKKINAAVRKRRSVRRSGAALNPHNRKGTRR